MSVKLPETLVLSITTHGVIPIENEEPKEFKVPEGMKITKVSLATIGVCNITTTEKVESISNYIAKVFEDTTLDTTQKLEKIVPEVKRVHGDITRNVEQNIKTSEYATDTHFREFLTYSDRPQTIKIYEAGQSLLDKIFVRSIEEGADSPYDYKINMLNVKGRPDLVKLFITGRLSPATRSSIKQEEMGIEFSTIADVLSYKGVKHLIVFDFSCSTMNEGTPRFVRAKRRRLEVEGKGGRKTRRQNKKTNRRKSKKRTARWSY